MAQRKHNSSGNPDDDDDESEEDENSDDECDGDDGLPVKEESEEDPNNSRTIEPTTFVNVSLACDEAGPSGLQQQKIGEMPEMVVPPTDGDPKSGYIPPDPLGPDFLTVKIMDDFFRIPKSLCYFIMRHPPIDEKVAAGLSSLKKEDKTDDSLSGVKKKLRSSTVKKSSTIAETKKYRSSDDEFANIESPVSRRKINIDEFSTFENKSDEPETTKPNSITKIRRSTNDDNDLDDVSLDQREIIRKKRKKTIRKTAKKMENVTYDCESCSLIFRRRGPYVRHMIKHSTVRSHKCDVCEKAFKRKSELKSHVQLHSGIKFNCDECNFVTTNKVSVRSHVRRVHQRDFRYKCEQCEKSFMSNSELKDHRPSHLGTKSFICEICGKAYLQKSHLVAHKRVVHGVVQKSLVKEHHCKICNKSFASEYILQNHGGVHSRKFLCTHCGKEFATNHGLQLHNRLHTGERPFQCKYCTKTFTRPNTLRLHNLTHTGERPYVCDLCGQSFTQRSSMIGHRKKHPGSHPPPPPTLLSRSENPNDTHS